MIKKNKVYEHSLTIGNRNIYLISAANSFLLNNLIFWLKLGIASTRPDPDIKVYTYSGETGGENLYIINDSFNNAVFNEFKYKRICNKNIN